MPKVLILLGSDSDLPITDKGISVLREMGVSFSVRIASAHRTPEFVKSLIEEFESAGGAFVIGVAGMSAHLAGVAASLTTLPVLAVPVPGAVTAGLDALLSMCNMPSGIPVATMGMGVSGFNNACLFVCQSLGLSDQHLSAKVKQDRARRAAQVIEKDVSHRILE